MKLSTFTYLNPYSLSKFSKKLLIGYTKHVNLKISSRYYKKNVIKKN